MPPEFYPEWIKPEVKVEGLDDEFWKEAYNFGYHPHGTIAPKYLDLLLKQLADPENMPEGMEVKGMKVLIPDYGAWTSNGNEYFYREGKWVVAVGNEDPSNIFEDPLFMRLGQDGWSEWRSQMTEKRRGFFSSVTGQALAVPVFFYDSKNGLAYYVEYGISEDENGNVVATPIHVAFSVR